MTLDNLIGSKAENLRLLRNGGFHIPFPTHIIEKDSDLRSIGSGYNNYIVRSSEEGEDSIDKTSAGKNISLLGIKELDLPKAVKEVREHYQNKGSVIVQPDITNLMAYSGVAYTNLNGQMVIALGKKDAVHKIVQGEKPETEIRFSKGIPIISGKAIDLNLYKTVTETSLQIEHYFGVPVEIEFALTSDSDNLLDFIPLQTRLLPNPTTETLKEHEKRKLGKIMGRSFLISAKEQVLGVGNYREILGDNAATPLSATIFNYIFSGDGLQTLGAVQLGRNKLGYNIGHEIFPWIVMLGGKVYYNFVGDAMQFRPKGISKEKLIKVINENYLPRVRGHIDLLNYSELQLYVQFSEQAEKVRLPASAYKDLEERMFAEIDRIPSLNNIPKRKIMKNINYLEIPNEIDNEINRIRTRSAKDYVKAARLAFFALEAVRRDLELLGEKEYSSLVKKFKKEDSVGLRDAIVYDESIKSFEVPQTEEYKYIGSFEMTLPRSFPPERKFKEGRIIRNKGLAQRVSSARKALEYREKVKFSLFRDYEYLTQLVNQLGESTGFGKDIYLLDLSDIRLTIDEPLLANYRIEFQKKIKNEPDLFPSPFFQHGIYKDDSKPELVFGSLNKPLEGKIGDSLKLITAVDQTVSISEDTKAILVPYNIRPGSHLFTVLSDYRLPVISLPEKTIRSISSDSAISLRMENNQIEVNVNG